MSYTVKLYGHLSDNPGRFCQQLADLLGTDLENATALVRDVPVIVRQGVPKKQAERIAADLASIRALCLIESEGDEPEPEEPPKPLSTVLSAPSSEPEEDENLRPGRMWLGIFVGILALILIVASVSFFSLFKKIYLENRATPGSSKSGQVGSGTKNDPANAPPSAPQMQERITSLEDRVEQIRSRIKREEENEAWTRSGNVMDQEDMQRSRQDLANLRDELRANLRELQQLKAALHQMSMQRESPL